MLVRTTLQAQLSRAEPRFDAALRVRLPQTLKRDALPLRRLALQTLATSRLFAIGDRAGVLSAAQRRSGRRFRLDVRQRVVVKALVSRHAGQGRARSQGLAQHIAYLGRTGAGTEGARPIFFDRSEAAVNPTERIQGWGQDRHHFRFIISPEHGDRIADLEDYTREVLKRVSDDLGEQGLAWIGTCHYDTDQPHSHIVVRGRRANGRDLVIPRDYIAFGFRARAQEVAQERLGDLSRADAERRIWRETLASHFTGFDRRLLQAADEHGLVDDGVGVNDAWAALTRGRLRHLEALGLASRVGRRYRLDAELEQKLRALQLRRDIIRTLHERRLATGHHVGELGDQRVRGRVVATGRHDELGGVSWAIVRDREGVEHLARLRFGISAPAVGQTVELIPGPKGAHIAGRARGLGRD